MGQNRNWQPWERQVVINHIQDHPSNFTLAFEQAASELNRSLSAVQNHFHKVIKKELDKQKVAITVQGSKNNMIVNSKNTPRRRSDQLDLVSSFAMELSKDEKKILIKELFRTI